MTRDDIKNILDCCSHGGFYDLNKAADRILAALNREKEGEVVLLSGTIPLKDFDICIADITGKRGQLVFRPTKEKI